MIRYTLFALAFSGSIASSWAETTSAQAAAITTTPSTVTAPTTTQPTATQPATLQQPSLRQNTATAATTPAAATLALQQKHKQEIEAQNKRLALLEEANQKALAQNQELQIKNDNLVVQTQVLQSERSAQMFLYGAVTFGAGTLTGIIIYSILYTRRRRSW